jgi:hypothetical protein
MATAAITAERENYLNQEYGIKSWLLTVDHKRIALLYLLSITVAFALGGAYAVAVRLELLTPQGDFFTAENYNKMFTAHGVLMVFFFMIPAILLSLFFLMIIVLAPDCASCGDLLEHPTQGPVCDVCWRAILPITPPLCDRCGDPLGTWSSVPSAVAVCSTCRDARGRIVDRARHSMSGTRHAFMPSRLRTGIRLTTTMAALR